MFFMKIYKPNKVIATTTIRFIVTTVIVVYRSLAYTGTIKYFVSMENTGTVHNFV